MKNILRIPLCALALSASFCARNTPRNPSSHKTSHKTNDTLQRVISLVPSITEILYALEAQDRLVAVTSYCDYPPEVEKKPEVGDFLSPDPERLRAFEPDLILLTTPTQAQLAKDLKAAGFRTAVFADPTDVSGVFAQIQAVADTLGVGDRGKALLDILKEKLSALQGADTFTTYAEISAEPLVSVGGASYLSDAFSRIGLLNIFSESTRAYPVVDPEQVITSSPQVILLLYPNSNAEDVQNRLGWNNIPAVKNGMVFDSLPVDELMRPGPRLIKGLENTLTIISNAR